MTIDEVDFQELQKGDIFFVNGVPYQVGVDAHYSGDASYDGYLLYDTHNNGFFPEDLDRDIEPLLLKNLKEGDQVWVEGDSSKLWIYGYNVRVSSLATVQKRPNPQDKKVLVIIDTVAGNSNVQAFVRKNMLRMVVQLAR